MLELETLIMLGNAVLYEYGLKICLYEYGPPNRQNPIEKYFSKNL